MPRRSLGPNTSWDNALEYVDYPRAACAARPGDDARVHDQVPRLEALVGDWEVLDGERRAAERAVVAANALVRRVQLDTYEAYVAVHNATLSHVVQNRASPVYKALFQKPPSAFARASLQALQRPLRALRSALADAVVPAALRDANGPVIERVLSDGEQALTQRDVVEAARGRTGQRLQAWKDRANNDLMATEGILTQVAASTGRSKAWVDSFFPRPAASKRRAAASDTPSS